MRGVREICAVVIAVLLDDANQPTRGVGVLGSLRWRQKDFEGLDARVHRLQLGDGGDRLTDDEPTERGDRGRRVIELHLRDVT